MESIRMSANQVFQDFNPNFKNTPRNLGITLPDNKKVLQNIKEDWIGILSTLSMKPSMKNFVWALVGMDAFVIMILFRVRKFCQFYKLPLIGRVLRLLQGVLYGIELGADIELGWGVHFVHSQGVVVGGHSHVGARSMFFGCNTVGTAKNDGHPSIGDGVMVSAGVRVLGPITVGKNAVLGANAVVLRDVPTGRIAVGVPAKLMDM
jgi:serine acetyltransferase